MNYVYDDGGRAAAGFKGKAGDCVCRAIAIAAGLPYKEVYDKISDGHATQRRSKHSKLSGKRTARSGTEVRRKWFKDYMKELGAHWVPVMGIGTGCKMHLDPDEIPAGRIVVSLSRHYAAVIDGVLHDTYDCSRNGTRCVYGYWTFES